MPERPVRRPPGLDLRSLSSRFPGAAAAAHRMLWPLSAEPSFVIVGAQKSGTSSLYRYLTSGPEVRTARLKEVHYFDDQYGRGRAWYRAQFPLAVPGRAGRWTTGEASPYYLRHPWAARRLSQDLPRARVVAILRNPTDRAYSGWAMMRRKGFETRSFEDALAAEREIFPREHALLVADPDHDSTLHRRVSFVARGHYLDQLDTWEQHVPAERMHVMLSERLFRDPDTELAALHEFLGIAPDPAVGFPVPTVGRYDRMEPATRKWLDDAFRAPNAALADRLGVDLQALGWS